MSRVSTFEDINKALYEWYSIACSKKKNIYPGGPLIVEKVKQIAGKLGRSEFKGLTKWKARYKFKVRGESGDVSGDTVESEGEVARNSEGL